ncbi:MAG: ferric reductase-like transmembrane domain-containing protein [bacterium]|nr:ferric reductase-like transmembrane domain-containing protein [bacterium]
MGNKLLANNRFYILSFSILLSVMVFAWLRLTLADNQLLIMRTQQIFGLLSIIYLYVALAISPVAAIVGSQRIKPIIFARRSIGVSAFYYGLAHTVIVFWGQMGGFSQVEYLPALFIWSLIGGTVAIAIMFYMTITSTDWFIRVMTYRWWKLSHRLIYIGGILILLHVWSLGTHLVSASWQFALLGSLAVLAGLQTVRIVKFVNKKWQLFNRDESVVVGIAGWAIVVTLVVLTPSVVPNYHSRHTDSSKTETTNIHKMMGH